ncbi:MAG TPA: hypothetical protein VFG95_00755, partial [Nitrospiria bacterium]|nr:hypothetical protein [Nitrospiria bacterium]
AITVTQVTSTPIATSLSEVNGTSVDPIHDVGMAFGYQEGKISLFKLSTKSEVGTYDTMTNNGLDFSGASGVKIAGAIMNPANQTVILATADGFEIANYTNPAAVSKVREIPSLAVDSTHGVEIMENFAFDPALPVGGTNHAMIITGGNQNNTSPIMVLVDADTGKVYNPDSAAASLFSKEDYIDSAGVDTNYHVAVLADEGTGTTFVDLNKLTLDDTAGTYSLPNNAVLRTTSYVKYDNLGVESTHHLVMMGQGYGGTSLVAGLLKDPALGLGFSKETIVDMPSGVDDKGDTVTWSGAGDPHGAGAYITPSNHPTYTTPTSLGLWLNDTGDHIAIIDLQGVLDGTLSGGGYDPETTTPKDISYFKIP